MVSFTKHISEFLAASSALCLIFGAGGNLLAQSAVNQDIGYLSSSSGYMLHRSGNLAVTANWSGQRPINGFRGYGPIMMDGLCLTGRNGNQPLTWENCSRNDKAQIWGFNGGRLNNELGWCADVEGNRGGAGVRVLAWKCSGATNQRWKAHRVISGGNVLSRIGDPSTRAAVDSFLRSSGPGQTLRLNSSQARNLPASLIGLDGATLIGLDGATLISAGGMNLISAGGQN